jgi:hypothetical protein
MNEEEEIRIGSLVRIKNSEQTALVIGKVTQEEVKKDRYFTFESLDEPIVLWRLALVEGADEKIFAFLQTQHLEIISR